MVITWGKDFSVLGTVGEIDCPVCRRKQPEIAVCQYQYAGVFWLFTLAHGREFLRVCQECKRGRAVEAHSLGHLAGNDNIPFMRKYGLLVLGAVIAFFIVASSL
jgi:hypothetical protein